MTNQEKIDFFVTCYREIACFCEEYFRSDMSGLGFRYNGFETGPAGIRIYCIDKSTVLHEKFLTWHRAVELGLFVGWR